jgi:hypothetical protein
MVAGSHRRRRQHHRRHPALLVVVEGRGSELDEAHPGPERPGLHNNVFAWIAAGDQGRVDLAWYGTAAEMDPGTSLGPDSTSGPWSLYFAQTLNRTSAAPALTAPILASEHHIHSGSIQTLIGHQNGNRALGDFLNLRIGLSGEAIITYSDSNNRDHLAKAMVVRQNGGPGSSPASPSTARRRRSTR